MKLGIVGLPNVGKSTLFNAITNAKAEAANYPFCTIDPNVGLVTVPDERLEVLARLNKSKKIVPAAIEFYDIAGLVRGASKGEGLGNKFLSHIRAVDAIVHVLRAFDDPNIVHVDGSVDPIRDIKTIDTELVFSDMAQMEGIYNRVSKQAKADKSLLKELELLDKIKAQLDEGLAIRELELKEEELSLINGYQFLTAKPLIYVANVSYDDLLSEDNHYVDAIREYADAHNEEVITVSVKIEEEIAELEGDEKKEFLNEMGLSESGLDKLVRASYKTLGLMSFLTTGEMETRAWTIKQNTRAQNAAGKIHSDIERGFIKAEVISYDTLVELGGDMVKAREEGKIRLEGKDYIMQEGDVVLFRFNV
ncbi:MAG: redox-regulated ATPase YchF [Ezakiella sp.]|nr:redox-regulated ATPase YchF [Ezakiella sp.]MDD7761403.1 redox-regulated ATPase YchF [Bacillota bacterium]MDY3946506.1 redox-regulated ATPase YchF [Ezakiella sp.]